MKMKQTKYAGHILLLAFILVVAIVPVGASAADIDLNVTAITPNSGAGGELFANETNTVTATILNAGTTDADAFTVTVEVAGTVYTANVDSLAANTSTTATVTDTVLYNGADSVTISATADTGNVIDETDETNNGLTVTQTVYNNGYKGKRWTGGSDMETTAVFDGQYNLTWSAGNTAYNGAVWTEQTYAWSSDDLPIPEGATVVNARLYQGWTYNKMSVNPAFTMSFNDNIVNTAATYQDIKGFGSYSNPYGMYVYNVTSLFDTTGNSMTITPEADSNYGIYGAYLVVVYEDPETSTKAIWMNEEFDMVYSRPSYSVSEAEATAYAPFSGVDTTDIGSATAIAILASAADTDKSTFIFNDQEYEGFWSDYQRTPQVGFSVYDVTTEITDGDNEAAMRSLTKDGKGDNMYAMATILVVESADHSLSADFTATPTSGTAPLTVQFTDLSTGATSWAWDFENDGIIDETAQNTSHVYPASGTYTVNLTVSDGIGSDTKIRSGYIIISPIRNTDSGDDDWEPVVKKANTGTLLTSPEGKILRDTTISSKDGIASLNLEMNSYALDSKGNVIKEVTITSLGENGVRNSPGVTFLFTGNAYECTPSGATFSPAITLTFTLTPEQWNTFADGELSLWFYNEKKNIWEEIPVTINPSEHTVTAKISHFSRFALFSSAAEEITTKSTGIQTPAQTPDVPAEPSVTSLSETSSPEPTPSPGFGIPAVCFGLLFIVFIMTRRS